MLSYITKLEDLSAEILMITFEYMGDIYNVFQAFFHLNQRLNDIILHPRLHTCINLTYENEQKSIYYHNVILPIVKPLQLTIKNNTPDELINFIFMDRLPQRLRSFTLFNVSDDQLKSLLVSEQLPFLTDLYIHLTRLIDETIFLYILQLPLLENCSFYFKYHAPSQIVLSLPSTIVSNIRQLRLSSLKPSCLNILLSHMPKLTWLTISVLRDMQEYLQIFSRLTHLKINVCSMPFQHLQDMLCCKELDQLKLFELSGLVREWQFITGENWERLMSSLSSTTKLKQFKIQNLHFYSLFYVQFAVLKLQLEVLQANDYLRQQNFKVSYDEGSDIFMTCNFILQRQ